jgi:hypothetical protein
MDRLREITVELGLADSVAFLGYVREEDELPALLAACRALIFPSLYEGFGMPVLEAMAFGKPVLCSNLTALPEVAGDAALYFDPTKPVEIANAIAQIEHSSELGDDLARKGAERVSAYPKSEELAQRYLQVLEEATRSHRPPSAELHGVYEDGWTAERVTVTYPAGIVDRHLEVVLSLPDDSPYAQVRVGIGDATSEISNVVTILRGTSDVVRGDLSRAPGYIQLFIDPVFQPYARFGTEDYRLLGCVCEAAQILSADGLANSLLPSNLVRRDSMSPVQPAGSRHSA